MSDHAAGGQHASTAPPHAIPAQATPLIGREREFAALQRLLRRGEERLITLTGPGGIGKTRLALAVAEQTQQLYVAGVYFVDLAPFRDLALVPAVLARSLGLRTEQQQSPTEVVRTWLRGRDLLLIFDNCEQIEGLGALVADMLQACPALVILATSRFPLGIEWEHHVPVEPLRLPETGQSVAELAAVPSVALFVARARGVRPDFTLDAESAPAIATLCNRLDGLPLAIELTAHLLRFLSPRAVLERLEAALPIPSVVLRDLPERQQSLHAVVEWSYNLLSPRSRRLFRGLAVIPGGFDADLALLVGAALDPGFAAEHLDAAVRELQLHNLLAWTRDEHAPQRLAMLHTIRDYAAAQLVVHDEQETAQGALVAWTLALAERADGKLIGPEQAHWLALIDRDSASIAAALRWVIEHGDAAVSLRLVAALWWSWYVRGRCTEGRLALVATLALPCEECSHARASALIGLGSLAYLQGDIAAATEAGTAGLALAQSLGYDTMVALGLNLLGNVALWKGDYVQARSRYESQIVEQRRLAAQGGLTPPAQFGLALSLNNLGVVLQETGDDAGASALHEESLMLMRGLSDRQGTAHAQLRLGEVRSRLGQEPAEAVVEEARQRFLDLGDRWGIARTALALGRIRLRRGEDNALAALHEALASFHLAGMRLGIVESCEAIADVLALRGVPAQAVRLLAGASAQREALGTPRTQPDQAVYDRLRGRLTETLGPREFANAAAGGALLTLDQLAALALAAEAPPGAAPALETAQAPMPMLTRRERQVLALLTRGLTNRQIAAQLFISERTTESHVQRIASKLGFTRRTQIAAWAHEQGLHTDAVAGD